MNERNGISGEMAYKYPIDQNAIPQVDSFLPDGYTKEEMKMVNETKKIIGDDSIAVTATCVRIPTMGGHSESVNIEFENDFDLDEWEACLGNTPGVVLQDSPENFIYPMPLTAHDKDETFVGRIRRDHTQPNTLNCWIVVITFAKGCYQCSSDSGRVDEDGAVVNFEYWAGIKNAKIYSPKQNVEMMKLHHSTFLFYILYS